MYFVYSPTILSVMYVKSKSKLFFLYLFLSAETLERNAEKREFISFSSVTLTQKTVDTNCLAFFLFDLLQLD